MNNPRSATMVFLEQQLMLSPKSIPELININPEINWKSVVNNARTLGFIRANGDFYYDHRKHKRYEFVDPERRANALPSGSEDQDGMVKGEVPACYTPQLFDSWKQMARLAGESVTICDDCQQQSTEFHRIVASGRCHQSVWSVRFFGKKSKELSNV